ncbi:tRNA (cmo5U34)-methyltransferase [compost metagenome]
MIVEKVVSEDSQINDTFVQLYHDLKQRNGLTAKEVIDKQKSIRGVMKPISIKENLQMLKLAGFDKIDTFFQWNNFAGFIAIK